jgi:DNA-binding transcriptional regulator YhcF (GntR family)
MIELWLVSKVINHRGGDAVHINFESEKPIFLQLAESLEDAILAGAFPEESPVPSITELSVSLKINPATALKGINILVDGGIVYKKRGIGMFVAQGARDALMQKRREQFFGGFVLSLVGEAKRLGLEAGEVKSMIERGFTK